MCGIAGILHNASRDAIERMNQIQRHRGPDDEGIFLSADHGIALGHRRLSILDLSSAGHQPMCDSTGRYWITFNGEIYNFKDIRKELEAKGLLFKSNTDTEVILESYKVWGPDCLQKFNGMFAFAIWDDAEKVLFGARDRIGVKPFYYYHQDRQFIFASEIKAIFESGLVGKSLDMESFLTPVHYQISPRTGFKHVRKLEPGSYFMFKTGTLTIHPFWTIEPTEEMLPDSDATDRLDHLMKDAIRLQMIADVKVGVLLSGGLDSSLITALMAKETQEPIHSFTIKYKQNDQKFERQIDDSYFARIVSQRFQTKHHEIELDPDVATLLPKMLWHLDEPDADPSAINTFLISEAARKEGITVLLNGMGGDEIFGGYRKHLACLLADTYQSLAPRFVQSLMKSTIQRFPVASSNRGYRMTRWAKRFLSFADHNRCERFILSDTVTDDVNYNLLYSNGDSIWDSMYAKKVQKLYQRSNHSQYLTAMCLMDTSMFLPDHNLHYCDKAAMAAGIEGRPPLTDHRIVEFMFRQMPSMRIRNRKQKYLLKRVASRYIPQEIIDRPKAPFGSPLRSWIRGALAPMVNEYLSPERLKQAGIFNPEFVWSKIRLNSSGKEDNAFFIWWLLCNQIWLEIHFKP